MNVRSHRGVRFNQVQSSFSFVACGAVRIMYIYEQTLEPVD